MYYQKTSILQLKFVQKYKNIYPDYKMVPWKCQVVPEILTWC